MSLRTNLLEAVEEVPPAANVVTLRIEPKAKPRVWQPQRFAISTVRHPSGRESWRVRGYRRDGTRFGRRFKTLAEAQCKQRELEIEWLKGDAPMDVRATRLTERQNALAETAFIRLGVEAEDELPAAIEYWLNHGRQNAVVGSPRLDEAVKAFEDWLKAAPFRPRTVNNLRLRVNLFKSSVGNLRVCDVTPETIDGFLDKRSVSAASKDNDRRAVSRFFSWCMERKRRWTATNPCRAVRVEKAETAPPAILTVSECERLLQAAQKHRRGRVLPYVAVCLLGGLRPSEAKRLTWAAVNLADREIRLEGNMTKTGTPRVVTVGDSLHAWLKACQGKPFGPANWSKDFAKVRRATGYGTATEAAPGLKPWPEDVMRHTAVSHYFRQTGSYGQTAEQFGNSEAIIKKHYQGRVRSAETKAFYGLMPAKAKKGGR